MAVTQDQTASHDQDHRHDHHHPHEHGHSHAGSPAEAGPGPSTGAVVLDIGGDIGAAVVITPASLDTLEIEIRRAGAEWDGRHVAVRARLQPGRPEVYAAVFPSLASGPYDLRIRFGGPGATVQRVEVAGGRVTTTRWPEMSEDPQTESKVTS